MRRLVALLPALVVLGIDLAFRADRILAFRLVAPSATNLLEALRGAHALAYALSIGTSALVWGSLLVLTRARRGFSRYVAAALLVTLFPLILAVQASFRLRWNIWLSRDATELSDHPVRAALGSLRLGLAPLAGFALALGLTLFLLGLSRRTLHVSRGARRKATRIAPIALLFALLVPVSYRQFQATTPDLLWFNAVSTRARVDRSSAEASMQLRSPPALPPLHASPARPRNVVLILQESVRADVVCIEHDVRCALATTATNEAAPSRFPFLQARSNASATAVAMAVLFTGLDPTAPEERLLSAPTLWEMAHAAGFDTAYFGSQHLLFANMWLWIADVPSGKAFFGTNLDTQADMFTGADDEALSARVASTIPSLKEPFFLVIHPSNVHTPRKGARIEGPFAPASEDKRDASSYKNGYMNAVHRSDRAVAAMLGALRAAPSGPRTVVVYTSDHGEAMWEHGQGCDHGCSLFEEEIRVPLWIDAPASTLSPAEAQALASAKDEPVFHVDVAATMLDLLGLWDAPELGPHQRFFLGRPLTRPGHEPRTIPLSNVSHGWERGLPSYGLMRGGKKLAAMHRHGGFLCHDVEKDPGEEHDLADDCKDLRERALEVYGVPPFAFGNLSQHPSWGPFVP